MFIKTITVSALNSYIKKTLDNDFILKNAHVSGEISNVKLHTSGHVYFSLKDDFGKINCIMFRSYAENLKFVPENGMNVVVKGRVSVYEKDGAYQLYCEEMEPYGLGDLYIAFEKLKKKLQNEGLFEESHKKGIPKFVSKIGVVTSPTGAAIRDIINISKRRNKNVDILIFPALVQGKNACASLIKGIETLNSIEDVDLIILARGGGSMEELWAYNEEPLAYAVYNSKKPVITGVGHETDFTIVDFVSDRRAPTPSAAAEIAVFNLEEFKNKMTMMKKTLARTIEGCIDEKRSSLRGLYKRLEARNPQILIANQYTNLDGIRDKLHIKIRGRLDYESGKLSKLSSLVQANNPLRILDKGYSIIQDYDNNIINKVEMLHAEEKVNITLSNGKVKATLMKEK